MANSNRRQVVETSKNAKVSKKSKPAESKSYARLSRVITACKRCRTKRIKCDKTFPQCTNCTKANCEDCMSIDAGTGETISRSLIFDIQQQLTKAQDEIETLRRRLYDETREPPRLESSSNDVHSSNGKSLASHTLREQEHNSSEILTASFARLVAGNESFVPGDSNESFGMATFSMVSNTFPFIKPDSHPKIVVPPMGLIQNHVKTFFMVLNVQLPIIHREHFVMNYLEPLYDKTAPNPKAIFFLNMIIAISTSTDQQKYSLETSNTYKDEAMKFFPKIWEGNDSKFEKLQSLLLLSQYSMMRPTSPGTWHLVGSSIRLCMEFGFHTEPSNPDNKQNRFTGALFDIEMKRRLFWCCYCLDRQVSIFYDKPFAIDDRKVQVSYPSLLDDLVILPVPYKADETHSETPPISKNVSYFQSCTPQSYKPISLHFIKLCILQGEIFEYIHTKDNKLEINIRNKNGDCIDNASTNNNVYKLKHKLISQWKQSRFEELNRWFQSIPEGTDKFTLVIFELNYHQTVIQLYGISLITPTLTTFEEYYILYTSSKQIVLTFSRLQKDVRKLNSSWMAANNLFLGSSCYLFLIFNCKKVREMVSTDEIKYMCDIVVDLLQSLSRSCDAESKNIDKFKQIRDNTLQLVQRERGTEATVYPNSTGMTMTIGSPALPTITPQSEPHSHLLSPPSLDKSLAFAFPQDLLGIENVTPISDESLSYFQQNFGASLLVSSKENQFNYDALMDYKEFD